MRSYAIGDIHGYLGELERAHALIAADRAACGDTSAPVVHIGDLCDRGPDTRGVLDFLVAGQARGEPWVTIKGNHDRMMEWFLADEPRQDPYLLIGYHWLHPRIGGLETLAAYGVTPADNERTYRLHARARAAVPEAHRCFLRDLPTSLVVGDALFVHAGIRPGIALADQSEMDLLWIRDEFHDDPRDHGALVVHGHTPIDAVTHYGNRVNIDTGAGYGQPVGVVVIEGRDVFELTAAGRVAVQPGG